MGGSKKVIMLRKRNLNFKILLFCWAVFITQIVEGQKKYFNYETITDNSKNLSFPVFNSSKKSLALEKINQHLQLSELELLVGHEKENIFEIVTNNASALYGPKATISFEIINNSNKILSLSFNESSCGMTCWYWDQYFNFNTANGDLITVEDLFTPEGFKKFKPFILKRRVDNMAAQLESDSISMSPEFKDEFLKLKTISIEKDDLSDFFIKDNSLFIAGENLLSKNERFSGIDMTCEFQLKEFKFYLNDYGKTVFMNTSTPLITFRSTHLPQLYSGTIGNERILLIFKPTYENQIIGIYANFKKGVGINLEGSLREKALYLRELTRDYQENGSIDAEYTWKEIKGRWKSIDGTKILPIKLIRK